MMTVRIMVVVSTKIKKKDKSDVLFWFYLHYKILVLNIEQFLSTPFLDY